MKYFGTVMFLLSSFCLKAQFTQQWVNNFCCFDSLQPHTFSYPLGKYVQQDTLTLSFYEDDLQRFRKVDLNTGNDIQNITLTNDTVQSPFYYGGGTIHVANHYITSLIKYNANSGVIKLFHNSMSENLTTDWSNEITVNNGTIAAPLSNLSATDFFTCMVSDSVRIYKFSVNGLFQWMTALPVLSTNSNDKPTLFLNSLDEVLMYVRNADPTLTNYSSRLIKVDGSSGAVLADTIYSHTMGTSHIVFQDFDTLKIAFIDAVGHFVSVASVDMLTMTETKNFTSNVSCFDELEKFAVDQQTNQYYIKSNSFFLGFTGQDVSLFNISLVPESQGQYDFGDIAFNQQYAFLSYSFFNTANNPVNNDILVLKIDKFNGAVIGSASYNDSRNTDENYLQHYLDTASYYVIFANNFDNISILQEETQIGIIKYNLVTQNIQELQNNESVLLLPNPVQNKVSVQFHTENIPVSYSVCNILGVVMKKDAITQNSVLDLSMLKEGVYSIVIEFQNKSTICKRFVKL